MSLLPDGGSEAEQSRSEVCLKRVRVRLGYFELALFEDAGNKDPYVGQGKILLYYCSHAYIMGEDGTY